MVTPLLDNGTIDYEGARRIADRMIDAGVSAIFLLGTTGESQSIAMHLAQEALAPPRDAKTRRIGLFFGGVALWFMAALVIALFLRHKSRTGSLEQQCRALRKSADLKNELGWETYPLFRKNCNARLSGIVDKLERRGLTEREIRIAVLVLIGFTYAEIAQILFRAESGIGKDKYLIAKQLGVSVKELQPTLRKIANSNV